jgi:D-alanyl-D-alanine carboxypeptidase
MHNTRRTFLIKGSLASAAWIVKPSMMHGQLPEVSTGDWIKDALQVAIQVNGCPGASVRITKDAKQLFTAVAGNANLETGTPISEKSVFRIGSLTKQFTAAAVLKLVELGKISLEAPVAQYLPFFSTLQMLTVHELLNHTAGLHSDESDSICSSSTEQSQVALAQEIAKQKPVFDFAPGTAWLYSNANYIVLGAIIELVYGKPLSEAMSELLFQPIKLTSTAFDHAADVVPNRVAGYTPSGMQGVPYANAQWIPIEEAGGAGALRATADDLCRWHNQLFGGHVISATLLNTMIEPGRLRNGALSGTSRFSADDKAMGEVQYAMGLLIPPPLQGRRTVLHYGNINGFSACLETYIDQGITVAILCNADINPGLPIRSVRKIVKDKLAR